MNPYQAPSVDSTVLLPCLPRDQWDTVRLCVVDVQRSRFRRVVVIDGDVKASVRYEAAGLGERLYVNDVLDASTAFFNLKGHPFNMVRGDISFRLRFGSCYIPASINVYCSLFQLLKLTEFRVSVCERVVYDDALPSPIAGCG